MSYKLAQSLLLGLGAVCITTGIFTFFIGTSSGSKLQAQITLLTGVICVEKGLHFP